MARLGPYDVQEELGRGGMGAVYRARDLRTGRQVALKVLLVLEPELVERFRREVEAVQGLTHPHLVRALELSLAPPRPYAAFELVDGESLARRVERAGPLPWPAAVEVAREVAAGLAAAHERGLLHRDVKPENVLLGPAGAKLADFGLVKDLERESLTETGATLGTPSYLAPEQVGSDRARWSEATDVYGLSATLYFALTGVPPFVGPSVVATLTEVVTAPPPSVRLRAPQVPPWLDAVVARGLAKQGSERFPSALALRAALEGPAPRPRRAGLLALAATSRSGARWRGSR